MAHNNLCLIAHSRGRLRQAAACYRQALELLADVDEPGFEARAHGSLGTALLNLGEPDLALESEKAESDFDVPDMKPQENSDAFPIDSAMRAVFRTEGLFLGVLLALASRAGRLDRFDDYIKNLMQERTK